MLKANSLAIAVLYHCDPDCIPQFLPAKYSASKYIIFKKMPRIGLQQINDMLTLALILLFQSVTHIFGQRLHLTEKKCQ